MKSSCEEKPCNWGLTGSGRSVSHLELCTGLTLASHGAHWGHCSHGFSGHCLQLRGRPGQRGQGSGLGQRLELGARQTACMTGLPCPACTALYPHACFPLAHPRGGCPVQHLCFLPQLNARVESRSDLGREWQLVENVSCVGDLILLTKQLLVFAG